MKNIIKGLTAATCIALSLPAFAAKPTSITFDSEGTTPDGVPYANYIVKCSNGEQLPLTAWDKRKKWCIGHESLENCHKKQIQAAKTACKS
jgi:hypothetical protein